MNDAFESIDAPAVDGIIGADILKKGFAVIDYEKTLFVFEKCMRLSKKLHFVNLN